MKQTLGAHLRQTGSLENCSKLDPTLILFYMGYTRILDVSNTILKKRGRFDKNMSFCWARIYVTLIESE